MRWPARLCAPPASSKQGRSCRLKIVVIGGTGIIGSKLVPLLRQRGQEVFAAAPSTGVSTLTREGLPEALAGAQVVVDVSNSPAREDAAVMAFFKISGQNLLAAEIAAGVRHHIALSVVGADRLPDVGYLRAKVEQEALIKASGTPYTILRATEFFEFGGVIADASTEGDTVRVPAGALIQPISSDDVASVLADIALGPPVNGTLEAAGPERFSFKEFITRALSVKNDKRKVVADPHARYFGTELERESLLAGPEARIGQTRYESWIGRSSAAR
ncbi:MAG TPA: SDR family oxidoreductase [Candidatus Binataceae bacterium]|nr:SDR family oxidoreductase [Candidatus Binataceae bacterium]